MPIMALKHIHPRAIAIGATAYLALAIAGFAWRRPDYSHLRHTISELGEFGAADALWVGWGVFFPVGLAAAALAAIHWRKSARAAGMLAACVAVGYIVAAFFPCDPGSPLSGSARQAVHNLGGAVEYFGGTAALLLLAWTSPKFRGIFAGAGVVVLLVSFGLSMPDLAAVRGLIQRGAEACLFGALILSAPRSI